MEAATNSPREGGKTKFALIHRAIVNADGLFRRLRSADDYETPLDVKWYSTDDICHRFHGPTQLGEGEALVLIALVASAAELHRRPLLRTKHAEARASQSSIPDWLNGPMSTTVEVPATLRQIAAAIGYGSGGDSLRSVQRSLERLSKVKVWLGLRMEDGSEGGEGRPLVVLSREKSGELGIQLAPFLTDAMLGNRAEHTMVVLSDITMLPASGFSRMLALRLCWINLGETREVTLTSLAAYLWHRREPSPVERTRLRAALKQLPAGSWSVRLKENA